MFRTILNIFNLEKDIDNCLIYTDDYDKRIIQQQVPFNLDLTIPVWFTGDTFLLSSNTIKAIKRKDD